MRVIIEKMGSKYRVVAQRMQNRRPIQSFTIGYATLVKLPEAKWMAKMFKQALRAHDQEKRAKWESGR